MLGEKKGRFGRSVGGKRDGLVLGRRKNREKSKNLLIRGTGTTCKRHEAAEGKEK